MDGPDYHYQTIDQLLAKFNMRHCNSISTPLDKNHTLTHEINPKTDKERDTMILMSTTDMPLKSEMTLHRTSKIPGQCLGSGKKLLNDF